jgi:tripeptide aminopeptidase
VTPEELASLPEVALLMARLCEIPSPSGREEEVAGAVREELAGLAAEITEDDAGQRLPAGCGNIVASFPPTAPGGIPIALCAHLDTVPISAPIEVELVDGFLTNRHPTILGGDDKAAVAAMVVALRRVVAEGLPHAGIELVLTPCEEIGLRGAALLDQSRLRAQMCFVFDHTGPIGHIVERAPSLCRIHATFVGRASHAGIAPEAGRSAIDAAAKAIARMPLGRIDAATTANVGVIEGGTATNVVAERCRVTAEARSLDERALSQQVSAMLDALTWAATEAEVDLETRVVNEFTGYRLSAKDPQLATAVRALRACGIEPETVATGGASDVNALLAGGLPSVNLCNDLFDIHTPDERIAVASLERLVDVTLALIAAAQTGH